MTRRIRSFDRGSDHFIGVFATTEEALKFVAGVLKQQPAPSVLIRRDLDFDQIVVNVQYESMIGTNALPVPPQLLFVGDENE